MNCEHCQKEFPDKELGRYKGSRICYQCATNKGIPADFESFLEDTPLAKLGVDPLLTGEKPKPEKARGNQLVTFLISAICAVATAWIWLGFPQYKSSYLFLGEGVIAALLARLLQKGRGGNHSNIVGIMILLSFFIPNLEVLKTGEMFDVLGLVQDFIYAIAGVFASWVILVEITPSRKKEKES